MKSSRLKAPLRGRRAGLHVRFDWWAPVVMRGQAVPLRHCGGRTARTSKPRPEACRRRRRRLVPEAQGHDGPRAGESRGRSRIRAAWAKAFRARQRSSRATRRPSRAAAATGAGRLVEKMKPRAVLTRCSRTRELAVMKAPKAPRALPRVPMTRGMRPPKSMCSASPAPRAPSSPVAWASSASSSASQRPQRSRSPARSAASPSMLKTASVATRAWAPAARPLCQAESWSSRSCRSPCRKTPRWAPRALAMRQPSTRDAWFSSSEKTASPPWRRAGIRVLLAWKPVPKSRPASWPFQAASPASRASCKGEVPRSSRAAPVPLPCSAAAWAAAAASLGSSRRPR